MNLSILLVSFCMSAPANEQILDSFQYRNADAARAEWVASTNTPAVNVVRQGSGTAVEFPLPFARDTELERTIHDRTVHLDLSSPGQFSLQLSVDHPEAVANLCLYFRSGRGWYSGSAALTKEGLQTIPFSKAAFHIEGEPAGWNQVDGIRISLWRGQNVDATAQLIRLTAQWHDIALIVPAVVKGRSAGDVNSARKVAVEFGELLKELGLGADAIDDSDLKRGALGNRKIAVLAHCPWLDADAVDVLDRFIDHGGKLFACYSIPAKLARKLGIERLEYVRPEQPGRLAEIRFNTTSIPGMPSAMKQTSWNIDVAHVAGHEAQVIGTWYDQQGESTGYPAVVLHSSGVYFSHILLTDDRANKRQFLAAILGQLTPPLWPRMATAERDRLNSVGHLSGLDNIVQYVQASRKPDALTSLNAALQAKQAADTHFSHRDYSESVNAAHAARERLVTAYLQAVPSRAAEGRAFWNHSGTGAYPGDWDRTMRELSEAGINMILPNMLWGGVAHYASDVLPRSKTYEQYGDQIAQCVAAGKKYGVEVHVWKVNHNLSGAPQEFVEKLRKERRLQVSHTGEPKMWLCPSDPANHRLEVDSMLEVAKKYAVDGLHFDYIRYPGREFCYCDGCRRRFQEATGLSIQKWPDDCYSGRLHTAYVDWRCSQITRLVADVRRETKALNRPIQLSAAVFGHYPQCRESVGQDWPAWIQAGYLDFVCPMDYTQSDQAFVDLVRNQMNLIGRRIPIYPGIGAFRLSHDRTIGQIHWARALGADGFTIFNLTEHAASSVLPALKAGAGTLHARPPHSRH